MPVQRQRRGAETPEQPRQQAARVVAVAAVDDVVEHVQREQEREQDAGQERRESLRPDEPAEERERAEEDARAAPAERQLHAEEVRRARGELVAPPAPHVHQRAVERGHPAGTEGRAPAGRGYLKRMGWNCPFEVFAASSQLWTAAATLMSGMMAKRQTPTTTNVKIVAMMA